MSPLSPVKPSLSDPGLFVTSTQPNEACCAQPAEPGCTWNALCCSFNQTPSSYGGKLSSLDSLSCSLMLALLPRHTWMAHRSAWRNSVTCQPVICLPVPSVNDRIPDMTVVEINQPNWSLMRFPYVFFSSLKPTLCHLPVTLIFTPLLRRACCALTLVVRMNVSLHEFSAQPIQKNVNYKK